MPVCFWLSAHKYKAKDQRHLGDGTDGIRGNHALEIDPRVVHTGVYARSLLTSMVPTIPLYLFLPFFVFGILGGG